MSSRIDPEKLSPFGRLAVKLDAGFLELTRLSGQIQRLDIESDSGLDHGLKLLMQFAQHGKDIADGIQDFSKLLQAARDQSETAVKLVGERAEHIRKRKQEQNQVRETLDRVEQDVKAANTRLTDFKTQGKGEIRTELERLNVDLKKFLADAQAVKDTASRSNFKTVERDAQTLLDAMRSSCRRVDKAITGQ